MIKAYFDDLAEGIETKLAEDPSAASARKALALAVARLGGKLFSPGQRVAWTGVLAPFEFPDLSGKLDSRHPR